MVHYPVVIPTLNRVNHLKRCLVSLMKNKGVSDTEIYISVDFPPSEKYQKGYEEVCQLLSTIDLSVFKNATIIYQKENLGAVKNCEFLSATVEDKYDAYIFSEDDNEFSPNFLEFVNKGLELFKDEPKVISICASKDTDWQTDGKNFAAVKLYAAYGLGLWTDKSKKLKAVGDKVLIPEKPYGIKKMHTLYKRNKALFCLYVLAVVSKDSGLFWRTPERLYWCDTINSLYMHFTDAVAIAPKTAKARTWGNDGSGENMPMLDLDVEKEFLIDGVEDFEYDNNDITFNEENYAIADNYLKASKMAVLKAIIIYTIILLFGKNRKGAIKFLEFPRKCWKKIKK